MGGLAAGEIRPLFLQSSLDLNNRSFELGALAGWARSASAQGAPAPRGMRLPLGSLRLLPSTNARAVLCFPNETTIASFLLATFA